MRVRNLIADEQCSRISEHGGLQFSQQVAIDEDACTLERYVQMQVRTYVPMMTQSRYCFLSPVQDGSRRVFTRDRRLWSPDTRKSPGYEVRHAIVRMLSVSWCAFMNKWVSDEGDRVVRADMRIDIWCRIWRHEKCICEMWRHCEMPCGWWDEIRIM